jgi:hypothetical protein
MEVAQKASGALQGLNSGADGTTKGQGDHYEALMLAAKQDGQGLEYLLGMPQVAAGTAQAKGEALDHALAGYKEVVKACRGVEAADLALTHLLAQITSTTTDRGAAEMKYATEELGGRVRAAKEQLREELTREGKELTDLEASILDTYVQLDCCQHLMHNLSGVLGKTMKEVRDKNREERKKGPNAERRGRSGRV